MLKAVDLTIEMGNKLLFKNVNFLLGKNEKVGLIGGNGTGKTTLFRLIAGEEVPTDGKLMLLDETVGYIQQELDLDLEKLVGEHIEGIVKDPAKRWKIDKILGKLKFTADDYQTIDTLSGGEKMKLNLAGVLYKEPTLLLLDEPTNHLDIDGIQWFKDFVRSFKGVVLMISHDRDLLNSITDKILEIDQEQILAFEGNYDSYVKQKGLWLEKQEEAFKRLEAKRQKLKKLLDNSRKIKDGQKRGAAVEAAKKRMEREVTQFEKERFVTKEYKNIGIAGEVHNSKLVLRADNLAKSFGDKHVLKDVSFEIRGTEKIWLYGPNGVGKTTLVKCIMGDLQEDSGLIELGENINVGYFAQKQKPETLEEKVQNYFMRETNTSYENSFAKLARYLFNREDIEKPLNKLSPGQQARLKFAVFAYGQNGDKAYDILILDEPTNHLDIPTKEVIESCVREFKGSVILISHDVYLVERIGVDRVFRMDEKRFR